MRRKAQQGVKQTNTQVQKKQRHNLKIIGAGLPKTGTTSLKVALERLGYSVVHGEIVGLNPFSHLWSDWENGDPWPAINCMLDMGFDATMDRPWCWAYTELLGLYPDAKVILSHYPTGGAGWINATDKWTRKDRMESASFLDKFYNSTPAMHFSTEMYNRMHGCLLGYPVADGSMPQATKDRCEEGYNLWYDQVIATVPPDQLLVYNVTQGWEPLCRFLEVADCPTDAFPHAKVFPTVIGEVLDELLHPGKEIPSLPIPLHC